MKVHQGRGLLLITGKWGLVQLEMEGWGKMAGEGGVHDLRVLIYKVATQEPSPLIGVFTAEEVQATPSTSQKITRIFTAESGKKQGGQVSGWGLYFYF